MLEFWKLRLLTNKKTTRNIIMPLERTKSVQIRFLRLEVKRIQILEFVTDSDLDPSGILCKLEAFTTQNTP